MEVAEAPVEEKKLKVPQIEAFPESVSLNEGDVLKLKFKLVEGMHFSPSLLLTFSNNSIIKLCV